MTSSTTDHAATRAAPETAAGKAPGNALDAGRRRAGLRRAALLLAVGLPVLGATAAAGRYWWPDAEAPALTQPQTRAPTRALPDAAPHPAAQHAAPAPAWQPAFALPALPPAPRLAADHAIEAPLPRQRPAPGVPARVPVDTAVLAPTATPPATAPVPARHQGPSTPETTLAPRPEPAIAMPAPDSGAGTPAAPGAVVASPATGLAEARVSDPVRADPLPFVPATGEDRIRPSAPHVALARPSVTPPARPAIAAPAPAAPGQPAPEPPAPATVALAEGLARSPVPPARPTHLARRPAAPLAAVPVALTTPAEPLPAATLALAPPLASDAAPDRCDSRLTRAIPRRPAGAEGGQAALARLAATAGATRDAAIVEAIAAGNMPDFLRRLVPVTLAGTGTDGRPARITLCVMPDYLALGSDQDFVRVPLGLPAARAIAERFDMVLPTTLMVDAIHAQARLRLTPAPMTPGPQMESTDYFLRHNATLEGQRRATGAPLGVLVSGHKKDLVLTNRLDANPGRVAIYGWHQASGRPIQPLSTVHGAQYADYSHGIRLVSRTAWVNGRATDLRDLLADSRLADLLSHEGPIAPRVMLAALR